jgi:hypothetical protein
MDIDRERNSKELLTFPVCNLLRILFVIPIPSFFSVANWNASAWFRSWSWTWSRLIRSCCCCWNSFLLFRLIWKRLFVVKLAVPSRNGLGRVLYRIRLWIEGEAFAVWCEWYCDEKCELKIDDEDWRMMMMMMNTWGWGRWLNAAFDVVGGG